MYVGIITTHSRDTYQPVHRMGWDKGIFDGFDGDVSKFWQVVVDIENTLKDKLSCKHSIIVPTEVVWFWDMHNVDNSSPHI